MKWVPGLAIHEAGPRPSLLPAVVIFHQGCDTLVWQHLPYPVERLPVELEGLLEQDLVLHAPLVWEWGEVRQILQCSEVDKMESVAAKMSQ